MEKIFREMNKKLRITKHEYSSSYYHIHEAIELKYVHKGEITANCDGEIYNLRSGDFFIVFPNQVHQYYAEEKPDNVFYTIIVSAEFIGRYYNIFAYSQPENPVCHPNNEYLIELIEFAYKIFTLETSKDVIDGLLISIFGMLLPHYSYSAPKAPQDRVSRIIAYCNEHYREEITTIKLSKELFISRSHISEIFNNKIGITFRDYINSLRIAEALSIINREHVPIAEAASRAGFSTIRTFNEAFKKKYNMTPTKYIKNHKAL